MTKVGKIARPDASLYKDKKKIYFVRNLYLPKNASDDYKKLFYRYWDEVAEHVTKLEVAGKVSKIFCESIYMTGEEAIQVLSAMNSGLEQLVKIKIDAGGSFLPLESKEIFSKYIDWYNCLAVARSPHVHEAIHAFLDETIKERFEHIKTVLKDNIADGEAALLIMRDEDRNYLELPDDIEMFFVTPPAYEDLMTFMRDSSSEKEYWREDEDT